MHVAHYVLHPFPSLPCCFDTFADYAVKHDLYSIQQLCNIQNKALKYNEDILAMTFFIEGFPSDSDLQNYLSIPKLQPLQIQTSKITYPFPNFNGEAFEV